MIQADEPPFGRALQMNRILEILRSWNYPIHLRVPGGPPLFEPVFQNDLKWARSTLAEACVDVNAAWESGVTVLHWAAHEGNRDMLELLIGAGAQVDKGDKNGSTPLRYAVRDGKLEAARVLIAHGANVNSRTEAGTPLTVAVKSHSVELVKLLLASGADPNLDSPIMQALPWLSRDESGVLVQPRPEDPRFEILRMLIRAGADVNAKDARRRLPLSVAIYNADIEAVRILLDAGAVVNAEKRQDYDSQWNTAIQRRREPIVSLLLQHSPTIDPEDANHLLEAAADNGWTSIAGQVLKRGATASDRAL